MKLVPVMKNRYIIGVPNAKNVNSKLSRLSRINLVKGLTCDCVVSCFYVKPRMIKVIMTFKKHWMKIISPNFKLSEIRERKDGASAKHDAAKSDSVSKLFPL